MDGITKHEEVITTGIPPLTGLQFLLLGLLRTSELSGRDLRAELAKNDVRTSAPAFYQLMARLEDQGFVEGWYVPKEVEGQRVRERRYKLLGLGERALVETADFYRLRHKPALLGGRANART